MLADGLALKYAHKKLAHRRSINDDSLPDFSFDTLKGSESNSIVSQQQLGDSIASSKPDIASHKALLKQTLNA